MENSSTSVSQTPTEKPRVLVVDDEYGPRESIAFALSSDFSVVTVDRAREALEKLKSDQFSVVILDIRMPEMDGIRALTEMRKIDPHVSIIMLTGYGTLLTAQQAMVGGANQYLRKPPDIDELLAAVRKQGQEAQLRRHHARINHEMETLNASLKEEIKRNEPHIWQGRASVELVHDLNNPLMAVIGYASLMAEETKAIAAIDPERAKTLVEYTAIIEKAANYCQHLAENWRQAASRPPVLEEVDLLKVAQEVRRVLFFSDVAIQFTGLAEARVRGSPYEMMRIFQNLFKNSLEAGATRISLDAEKIGDSLHLTIADNGCGMDAEKLAKAMKGGYTSKKTGTGLGLSICRYLLGAQGATFKVESAVGQGTTMRMVFPSI